MDVESNRHEASTIFSTALSVLHSIIVEGVYLIVVVVHVVVSRFLFYSRSPTPQMASIPFLLLSFVPP